MTERPFWVSKETLEGAFQFQRNSKRGGIRKAGGWGWRFTPGLNGDNFRENSLDSSAFPGERGGATMDDIAPGIGHTKDEFYLTLFEEFPALIWRANTAAECDWFNKTWLEFTGRTMEQEYGNGWAEGVHPDDLRRCVDIWNENFSARTPFVMDYRLRRNDGDYRWIRDYGRPFDGPDGEFHGFIGACYDIQDLRTLTAELEHQATHDALTGVGNRRAFEAEISRAIASAGRGVPSTVLFTDVDRFKVCNDLSGHEFGDTVLQEIAAVIVRALREVDHVARIGGDEFGILLSGEGIEDIGEVCRRLDQAVVSIGDAYGVDIGLSIGAAEVSADGDVTAILAKADRAMYAATRRT